MTDKSLGFHRDMKITPAPDLCRAMDPDIALGRRLSLVVSMAPCGSAGHSSQHDLAGGMALRYPHGCRLQPRLHASVWPLVTTWLVDIYTDPGYAKTLEPDLVLDSSPGSGVVTLTLTNTMYPFKLNCCSIKCTVVWV